MTIGLISTSRLHDTTQLYRTLDVARTFEEQVAVQFVTAQRQLSREPPSVNTPQFLIWCASLGNHETLFLRSSKNAYLTSRPNSSSSATDAVNKAAAVPGGANPNIAETLLEQENRAISRKIIDPTDENAVEGLGYSLWNFRQSAAQRIYRLNLFDAGGRAVLYLLQYLKELLPDCQFTDRDSLAEKTVPVNSVIGYDIEKKQFTIQPSGIVLFSFQLNAKLNGEAEQQTKARGGNGMPTGAKVQHTTAKQAAPLVAAQPDQVSEPLSVSTLRRAREVFRVAAGFDAEVKLAKVWKSFLDQDPRDQNLMLLALSADFSLSLTFCHMLITYAPLLKHKILFYLLHAVSGRGSAMVRTQLLIAKHYALQKYRTTRINALQISSA